MKKWGLAPMTGSLAPPPPYGSEQGSILLEAGRESTQSNQGYMDARHGRSRSRYGPVAGGPTSPGPVRSSTDISLAQLALVPSHSDVGEGTSRQITEPSQTGLGFYESSVPQRNSSLLQQDISAPPPDYSSPQSSPDLSGSNNSQTLMLRPGSPRPEVPSYDVAMGSTPYSSAFHHGREDEEEGSGDIQAEVLDAEIDLGYNNVSMVDRSESDTHNEHGERSGESSDS